MKDTRKNMTGGGCIAFEPGIASRDGGHVYGDISGTLRKDPGDNQMTVVIKMNSTEPIPFDAVQITSKANRTKAAPGKDHGADAGELSPTLRASGHDESQANAGAPPAIAFPARMSATQRAKSEEVSPAIGSVNPTAVGTTMAVRRLTPVECEFLQGFSRDFTLVQFNGKPACDGPRYKAIGNSMAVPVIEWIGRRIDLVDELVPYKQNTQ